jgi:hypothetical protein
MIGGELPSADAWTTSLLTNREVLAVDQHSTQNRPVIATDATMVWLAESEPQASYYLAVFNRSESAQKLHYAWKDLTLGESEYSVRDLWERKDLGSAGALAVTVPAHGTVFYRLQAISPS